MNGRIAAAALIVVLVVNLVLFVMGLINDIVFWPVIIVCAVLAYHIIPRLKK